ncbi:4,5-DOPA dioxygenase extradiol [Novosphingobium sp. Gsoil 351]|uniref:4,5-DOPA-extradiol-dioxygenase n=1 Tax=Novosphingobium sp. Gsoil 351 TaxID=2675225 RepID=UPI0012B4F397|nr:4,5-DOPA dioxygenase extradiol [Novosphingobium sp. Gsoil 351]QGN53302.1 4,5-DOPA dioxygenase extradiol [Novosphingobium sp. Gsoil 351]
MTQRLPALFLGHGSPMTTITDGPERRAWQELGRTLPRPRAILAITAHWETHGRTHLTAGENPRTIHDFRGFPQELFDIRYPAPGSAWLADRVGELLGEDRIVRDDTWGFDHGVWGVLQPMYPEADIPLVAMSLDRSLTPAEHLALGGKLAPLRDEGVLIVASGNVVHNLALWRQVAGTQPEWALAFREEINAALAVGDEAPLLSAAALSDEPATFAVNSGEHFLPLLYAAGARLPGDEVAIFNDTLDGALSMTSVAVGDVLALQPSH